MKQARLRYIYLVMLLILGLLLPCGAAQAGDPAATTGLKSQFSDVKTDNANLIYITYLNTRGIMGCFPDGSFHPGEGLTRAQAAVIISKAVNLNTAAEGPTGFKDVNAGNWAAKYIAAAVQAGYLKGFPDGSYKPDSELTRAQAISLIMRLSKESDSGVALPQLSDMDNSHWAARAIAMAIDAGMITAQGDSIAPDKAISREDISKAVAVLLTADPQLSSRKLMSTLTVKSGDAKLSRGGSAAKNVKGSAQVGAGDTIETGKNSSAIINYPDGSSLMLKDNTTLIIKESDGRGYIKKDGQPGTAVDNLVVEMKIGKMFGGLSSLAQPVTAGAKVTTSMKGSRLLAAKDSRYDLLAAGEAGTPWYKTAEKQKVKVKVDMPWGVAAIRGSFWQSAVNSNGSGSTNLLEGSAQVIAGGQTVSLSPGEASGGSTAGGPPSAPAPMTPQQAAEWTQVQSWVTETAATMTDNQGAPPAGEDPSGNPGTPAPDPVGALTQALSQAISQASQTAASAPSTPSSSSGGGSSGSTFNYGTLTTLGIDKTYLNSGYTIPVALRISDSANLWTGADAISIKVAINGSYTNAIDTAGIIVPTITPTLIDDTYIDFSLGAGLPVGQYAFIIFKNGMPVARATLDVIETAAVSGYYGISGGISHSLQLLNSQVKSWGSNSYGQLGDGTINNRPIPAVIPGFSGIKAVAAGSQHSLALKSDGTVWAWGASIMGQLGTGSTSGSNSPVQVMISAGTPLTEVTAICAGDVHNLALKSDGTVYAWGNNSSGELGMGNNTNYLYAVQIPGLTGVKAIAGDYGSSLALKNDGTVWAWGSNSLGQLGDGTTTNSNIPVQVLDASDASGYLTSVKAIAGGMNFSLALKSDGTVCAWGDNYYGYLGDGTTTSHLTPQPVSILSGITAIDTGAEFGLALKNDGTIYSWGHNEGGQLGLGDVTTRTTPQQISTLSGISYISAGGGHGMAMQTDGTLWTWGYNDSGQLGNLATTNSLVPIQPICTAPLVLGYNHSLPVPGSAAGTLKISNLSLSGLTDAVKWQVKTGTGAFAIPALNSVVAGAVDYTAGSDISATPGQHMLMLAVDATNQVKGFADVVISVNMVKNGAGAIATGWSTTYALKTNGSIWGWGWNNYGQVGNNDITDQYSATYVTTNVGTGIVSIEGGKCTGYAVKTDGSVLAWGLNDCGQLGDGTTTNSMVPVTVNGLSNVTSVASWWSTAYAVRNDGTLWGWGENNYGQLGAGITGNSPVPVQVAGVNNVTAVCCVPFSGVTDATTYILKTDGTVWGWGNNSFGQLGDGTNVNSAVPVQVNNLTDVIDIACNGGTLYALKSDGTVWACGNNGYGQLGNNSVVNSSMPVQVTTITGVIDIAAGDCSGYALKSDGTVWSWGWNGGGVLGDGTTAEKHVPVPVSGLSNIVAIEGGRDSGHALQSNGAIWGWGSNGNGELGNNTTNTALIPVQVIFPL